MSNKKLKLQISTPDRNFYDGEVDSIIVTAMDGEIGILPRHLPIITVLDIGLIKITNGDEIRHADINGGFMEVQDSVVTILTDSAEWPEEVDVARAEKAIQRAEARLSKKKDTETDYARAELALKRAMNRIKNVRG